MDSADRRVFVTLEKLSKRVDNLEARLEQQRDMILQLASALEGAKERLSRLDAQLQAHHERYPPEQPKDEVYPTDALLDAVKQYSGLVKNTGETIQHFASAANQALECVQKVEASVRASGHGPGLGRDSVSDSLPQAVNELIRRFQAASGK